jgi:hypothetical protein
MVFRLQYSAGLSAVIGDGQRPMQVRGAAYVEFRAGSVTIAAGSVALARRPDHGLSHASRR